MSDCGIIAEEYVCSPTEIVGTQDELKGRLTRDARARLEAAIQEIVSVEAPIELDALTRKVGKRFGYQRVAKRWKRTITYRIPGGVLVGEGSRSFVWPEEASPSTWRRYRKSNGARTIGEIPTTELANAIVAAVADAPEGLDHIAAYRAAMALFGLTRLTESASSYLEEALTLAVIRGDLHDEGTTVSLAPSFFPALDPQRSKTVLPAQESTLQHRLRPATQSRSNPCLSMPAAESCSNDGCWSKE
ncbi:DUF3320 domain-containing protein [Corynebacterium testudinoris]|uniref:Putative DUF3320 family protein n=1 Tax=Corynebacterium testudinoris TaxID=136857 RepID=A0A0G3HDC7_9CORY|nr:DUF3320 domain-containing protein [Corynebacterium testudinoris]AKK09122.1 putative DUF3320 family protein [Corynebacterium testudinoris]